MNKIKNNDAAIHDIHTFGTFQMMCIEFPVLNNILTSCNIYVIAHTQIHTYKCMDMHMYAYIHVGAHIYSNIRDS